MTQLIFMTFPIGISYTINEITSQQSAEKTGETIRPSLKAEFYPCSNSCEHLRLEEMEKINK